MVGEKKQFRITNRKVRRKYRITRNAKTLQSDDNYRNCKSSCVSRCVYFKANNKISSLLLKKGFRAFFVSAIYICICSLIGKSFKKKSIKLFFFHFTIFLKKHFTDKYFLQMGIAKYYGIFFLKLFSRF